MSESLWGSCDNDRAGTINVRKASYLHDLYGFMNQIIHVYMNIPEPLNTLGDVKKHQKPMLQKRYICTATKEHERQLCIIGELSGGVRKTDPRITC